MKAVNLIPADERRSSGAGAGIGSYILLALLALVVVGGAAFTLVNRDIKDKRKELASVQQRIQAAQNEAEALKAYTAFTAVRQQRSETVRSLATSRFDWAHALHEVARTMPKDAWLASMRATVTPTTTVEGGVADPLRAAVQSPAIEIVGCTTSQDKVAGVISSLRRADGVQRISLSSSERLDAAAGAGAGNGQGGDCRNGNARFPKFSMTLFFNAPTPTASQGKTTP
jgi:Tfp pilus assembly protein PilN